MSKMLYSKPLFLFKAGSGSVDAGSGEDDDWGTFGAQDSAQEWSEFYNANGAEIAEKSNFDVAAPETYPEGFDPSNVNTYDTLMDVKE